MAIFKISYLVSDILFDVSLIFLDKGKIARKNKIITTNRADRPEIKIFAKIMKSDEAYFNQNTLRSSE
ncbi:MAG: hypothetical protein HYV52_01015 [Parcubacteria group bacterium]|nr:hypothetical protein [Parcubacteria group bacterium]